MHAWHVVVIHKSERQIVGGVGVAATVASAIVVNLKAASGGHCTWHVSTLLLQPLVWTLARNRYSVNVAECILGV